MLGLALEGVLELVAQDDDVDFAMLDGPPPDFGAEFIRLNAALPWFPFAPMVLEVNGAPTVQPFDSDTEFFR